MSTTMTRDATQDGMTAERGVGWQPIETAPKDGTTILVCNEVKPGEGRPGIYDAWWESSVGTGAWVDGCTDSYDDLMEYHPAYWMPLPAPPTAQQVRS